MSKSIIFALLATIGFFLLLNLATPTPGLKKPTMRLEDTDKCIYFADWQAVCDESMHDDEDSGYGR